MPGGERPRETAHVQTIIEGKEKEVIFDRVVISLTRESGMILKHDEAEPLELSSGPYGDVDMESLNGRWISQSAMAPAKDGEWES